VSHRAGGVAFAAYMILLVGAPVLAAFARSPAITHVEAFYRSGALVFGGGHVVLPLLQRAVVDPGWIGQDLFLAGYAAAQALPGPLFTFSAFLGAAMSAPPNGVTGASLALAAIFLPGLLALLAALPFWSWLRSHPSARAAMSGANAAVVGILAAALYDPVWVSSVGDRLDFVLVAVAFVLLTAFRSPPILVVALSAVAGLARVLAEAA
jgi:chromate transporter